jgi:arginyl-tRNA synthetase
LEDERGEQPKSVSMAAVKYAFLKYKIGGDIIFDVKDSVSMTGNSGPYLQYAAVRARKVLASVGDSAAVSKDDWGLNEYERDLTRKILEYRDVLEEAITEFAPHKICTYLYELAQTFNRFYEKVKVVGSEYEAERGCLVEAYLNTLLHGLNLVGIEVPEEM